MDDIESGFIRAGICGVRDSRRKTAERFRRKKQFTTALENLAEESPRIRKKVNT